MAALVNVGILNERFNSENEQYKPFCFENVTHNVKYYLQDELEIPSLLHSLY
jgi:hypothetical protein